MDELQQRLSRFDLSLFSPIVSQTTADDKKSLLALQAAVREQVPEFVYLEIGSHLGGSLQPYVVDPRCLQIFSIDPRPARQADARGTPAHYHGNSTERMLELLGAIPGANIQKIRSFEAGTDTLTPALIPAPPHFCFIDGEHTDPAALRDARFCLSVIRPDGCIAFHDANLVYGALGAFLEELRGSGRPFRPYVLPDAVFVIDLGAGQYGDSGPVQARRAENYKAYLAGMQANDWYREAWHKPVYRFSRSIRSFLPRR